MKQYIFSFFAGIMIFMQIIIAHAAPVTVNILTSQELVCDGTNANEYWYVGERHYPRDAMYGNTAYDWKISPSSTISIYNPLGTFQITGGFNWRSFGQPKGVTGIYVWQNDDGSVITTAPANPNTLVAQIVHRVRRMYSEKPIAGQYTIEYTNLDYQFLSTIVSDFTGPILVDNECQNIYARWCGDGILDTSHGEQCDLGAQNGQAGSACSATCQTVTPSVNPYSACVVGNPTADCATNTYVDQAACLLANPGISGRTCYLNDIPSCNTTRAIQCPSLPACIPGTLTGPQSSQVTSNSPNLCPTGQTVGGFTGTLVGTNTVYNWSCNGSSVGGACSATYDTNSVACIPGTLTGPQSSQVTSNSPNLCPTGQTVGGFTGTLVGTNTVYNWSCNGSVVGGACSASYDSSTIPNPVVSIKKYAKSIATGDTESSPISIAQGETFSYFYQVQNTGSVAATGVVVKDTLPQYLTFTGNIIITNPSGVDVTSDWTISTGSQLFGTETIPRIYLILTKKTDLPGNSGIYTFNIPVKMADTVPTSISMQNIAYICATNTTTSPTGPNGEVICGNPNPPPPPPPGQCTPTNNPLKDPACIIVGVPGFDLSLKKYIGTNDAQTVALGVSTTTNAVLTYVLRVTNSSASTKSTSGTTTVQDILPAGVGYDGTVTGAGWTCTITSSTLRCTSVQVIASGASYPDITVPIRVSATAGQSVTNIAAVDNPAETRPCINVSGGLPATESATCTLDTTNSDPAVLSIPGGGGVSHVGKICINGVASCANFNSLIACMNAGVPASLCYAADSVGLNSCQSQNLICSGNGGGGGGGGGYVTGYCGDGVLGSSPGEECDVRDAPSWCLNCKIKMTTNPGENPITDLWTTIPTLAGTKRIGYSWLDNTQGKVAFEDNRMVLGVGTKAFTLADTVGFGIQTRYVIPIILEATKKMCLISSGVSMNSEEICTTIGDGASISPGVETWTRVDGTKFVNIGKGDYQKVNPTPPPPIPLALPAHYTAADQASYDAALQVYYAWRPYIPATSTSPNNIILFKGASPYTRLGQMNIGPTLNSAFFGRVVGTDGKIGLYACSGTDCSPDSRVNLVELSVKVSGAVVSSIGSSANRSLEAFINPGNLFSSFMSSTTGVTSTTSNNTSGTATVTLPVIVGGIPGTVVSVSDIERYAVNGNKNVLAVNGDLTIACPVGRSVFEMSGIRTVIVSGNLIIKCNIVYPSNDHSSSWAWITKGGNIQVFNGDGSLSVGAITNLAGVFVSIKEGSIGGNITYTGNNTTQAILRVEGSMYGDATPLFNSRLYARATGAYDILTTGTILTYSNRALMNPPPLLSQYLGNYQVQQVTQ